jgi:hypothetical protein
MTPELAFGVATGLVVPILLATFWLGPLGLLVHF